MMEKSPMQKSLVQEEYEQLEEQNKKLEQENMQLKSKLEVLQDVIVRLKKDPDNSWKSDGIVKISSFAINL